MWRPSTEHGPAPTTKAGLPNAYAPTWTAVSGGRKLASRELVRAGDPVHGLHSGNREEGDVRKALLVTNAPDDGSGLAPGQMGSESESLHALADLVEFVVGDVGSCDDDQGEAPGS